MAMTLIIPYILTIATQAFTGLAVLFPTTIAALYGKNWYTLFFQSFGIQRIKTK
jgi:hypothetical protein